MVALQYDSALLSLQSYAVDSIWGSATESTSTGSLGLLMNCPADCSATNTDVQGEGIPILTARLKVGSSAAAGAYADAVSVAIAAMLNFGNNFIVEGASALVLDHRDDGSSAGEVVVEEQVDLGLFAYPPDGLAVLSNTAPVTGGTVSVGAVSVKRVTSRPAGSSFSSAGVSCSTADTSVLTLSGCTLSLASTATGGGAASVSASSGGLEVTVPLVVWYPSSLSLVVDDTELGQLSSCTSGGSKYQRTRLRLLSGALELTPLLQASDVACTSGLLEVHGASAGRLEVEGLAAGSASCALAADSLVQVSLTVSDTAVGISALHARAITGVSLLPLPALGTVVSTFYANVSFTQTMEVEGSTTAVYAYVATDDGQVVPVPHDELSVTTLTDGLEVSSGGGSTPWSATITSLAIRECGGLVSVQWLGCDGELATTEPIITMQLPEPVGVRITSSTPQLAPAGDAATLSGISWSSSKSLTIKVDFEDPFTGVQTERDFSNDPRMHLVADTGCVSLSGRTISIVADDAASGCPSATSVSVYAVVDFGTHPAGQLQSEPLTVSLVRFSTLELTLSAYPSGPSPVSELRQVQCSSTYQSAKPSVTASLSVGGGTSTVTSTVTGQCTYSSSDTTLVVHGSGGSARLAPSPTGPGGARPLACQQ